jgi:hypothetical protein
MLAGWLWILFKSEISQWVQVYASITPVVHLVNVGSESGGVQSLANVTVCPALPPIAAENFRCSNFRFIFGWSLIGCAHYPSQFNLMTV